MLLKKGSTRSWKKKKSDVEMVSAFESFKERVVRACIPCPLQILYWGFTGTWFEISGLTGLLIATATILFFLDAIKEFFDHTF